MRSSGSVPAGRLLVVTIPVVAAVLVTAAVLVVAAGGTATAHTGGGDDHHGGPAGGIEPSGGIGWTLVWVVALVALLGGVTGGAYWLSTRTAGNDGALATLWERRARGEIDDEEFTRRRARLVDDER